jgi:hypothetical protein
LMDGDSQIRSHDIIESLEKRMAVQDAAIVKEQILNKKSTVLATFSTTQLGHTNFSCAT